MGTAYATTGVRSLLYRCADPQDRSRWLDDQLRILTDAGVATQRLQLAGTTPASCQQVTRALAEAVELQRARTADPRLPRTPQILALPDYDLTSQRLQQWWAAHRSEDDPRRCPALGDMLTLLAKGHQVGIYVLATTARVVTPDRSCRQQQRPPRPATTWWHRLRLQGVPA